MTQPTFEFASVSGARTFDEDQPRLLARLEATPPKSIKIEGSCGERSLSCFYEVSFPLGII